MLRPFSTEWKKLLHRLTGVAGDVGAAEDALQSAYIRVEEYRRAHTVHHAEALFVRTATNLALDHRRRIGRVIWSDITEIQRPLYDEAPLQDEVLAARERLSIVQTVLSRLPERTRKAFLMHRLDDLKYREIAQRLGVSISAVEKHIARATLALAEAIRTDGDHI